jgi:hypothetical protein
MESKEKRPKREATWRVKKMKYNEVTRNAQCDYKK